ncbi:hypothetical protein AB0E04_24895 [Streptomyces sp. NPDC048251]|uniref:hypothetical protein n=1 Tax=Streptomyces sp. NPDC048251 TaxID=3154501 RepID=UPI00342C1A07
MRLLGLAGRWEKLAKAEISKGFPKEVDLSEKFGNEDSVTLPKPLTVVFGLNGTGKTRLLRAISENLDNSPIVSMYELVNYLLHDFGKRDDIDDLLDELDPLEPEKVKASEVQDLVRRDYEEMRWYAVQILDSPFAKLVGEEVVPVFVVRHEGLEYDFRSMGLGELSVHLLMWILSYSKGSENTAFLLDEPEAFLPAPSRTVLLSHLIEICLNGGKPLVIASHSLEIIQPALDADAAIMLTTLTGESRVIGPSADLQESVAGLFGKTPGVDWVIFLEDEAATILMQEIVRATTPRLWQGSRFLWCKGYGDLESIWSRLPRPAVPIEGIPAFAFVADGDKRDSVQKNVSKNGGRRLWPFFCLPGDPDSLMKASSSKNLSLLAQHFGVSVAELLGFLESIQGREAHNWLEEVLKYVKLPRQEALKVLAAAVVKELSSEQLAETMAALKR